MNRFFDALFIGLSAGSIYALVALGLVVIYRATAILNFAQGEMATLSAYIAWLVAGRTLPLVHWVVPLWLATGVAMAFGFAFAAGAELTLVRPLARRSALAVFVGLIALFLGINALTSGIWNDPQPEIIGSLFPNAPDDFVRIFGAAWRYRDIGTLVLTLVLTALLFALFQRTKFGLAMRATASNAESGKLVGIPTGLILAASWGIAGALGAIAAVLQAGANGQVTPILMFNVFIYAAAAATLGGLDSPIGAVVGGLLIGVVENLAAEFAPGWIGQQMKLSVALVCILVVLLVRPAGLFGTVKVERV